MTLTYTAAPEDAGRKLFSLLRYRLHLSAGLIKRLKYQTVFQVNGQMAYTNHIVSAGDRITLTLPEEQADFPPEAMELHILYEDEALIALHKPVGIIIHPSATRNTGTLANGLLAYLGSGTVHPVNRLDRDTTGVTIFAKNGYVKSILTESMEKAQIHKTYLAPTYGALPEKNGVIDLPIDRVNESSLWRTIREDGQPARTAYELLLETPCWNLYAFHPLTGRTHQIRLHAMASGAPLLGDPVYHSEESLLYSDSMGLFTQCLTCVEMTFPHPITGKEMTITTRPEWYQSPWFQEYR
ncbi:MAG: RluA family pseudouridine synthase [Oscillospiraceae bacterium]|nr:RluA family pseudouridine synthase [Oscillospiraceae bacterium]